MYSIRILKSDFQEKTVFLKKFALSILLPSVLFQKGDVLVMAQGLPAHHLSREARKAGMPTLLQHGLELSAKGIISFSELTRVVSE